MCKQNRESFLLLRADVRVVVERDKKIEWEWKDRQLYKNVFIIKIFAWWLGFMNLQREVDG